jgi:hypothetical protein
MKEDKPGGQLAARFVFFLLSDSRYFLTSTSESSEPTRFEPFTAALK